MSRTSSKAVLLVDGYNIIGLWPRLRKMRDHHSLEAARRELSEDMINYSAFHEWDTRLVFDAQYQYTGSTKEIITEHLSVYYTEFGQTADSYIEKTCALLRDTMRHSKQRLIVATSDRAQRLTVVGYGAEWMSAHELAHEVESTARHSQRHHKPKKHLSSRFLGSGLDPESQRRLNQLAKELRG